MKKKDKKKLKKAIFSFMEEMEKKSSNTGSTSAMNAFFKAAELLSKL